MKNLYPGITTLQVWWQLSGTELRKEKRLDEAGQKKGGASESTLRHNESRLYFGEKP